LDQLLHLRQLGLRSQHNRVVTGLRRLAEQHAPQPVERIARPCAVDGGTKAAHGQHRGRRSADDCQPKTVAALRFLYARQRGGRLRECDDLCIGPAAYVIAPGTQHRRQRIHRRHPRAGGQRIDEAVGAHDRVEAGVVLRHSPAPLR
jgi:hypothetical protein